MMKRIVYILCLVATLSACKDKTKFTIEGKVENFGSERKVFLYGMKSQNMDVVDSTVLSEKGEFKFTGVAPEADFYRVNIGAMEYMVIAKNGDVVKLTADLNNKNGEYAINGGEESEGLADFNKLKNAYTAKIDVIKNEFEQKVSANPEAREQIIQQISPRYMKAIADLNAAIAKFANDHTNSLVSFYAISLVNPNENEKELIRYAENVSSELKKNAAVRTFVEKVNKLKVVQVGQMAPQFTISGLNGTKINLSDYKGKYVLLDFWASWCAPCRNENPNVVKAYQAFKDKNFAILGISLDKDKGAWEQAIKQDGLAWDHAGELADFQGPTVQLYQVEAIPASFLIDPSGKIIARNLRGDELMAFLNKTLL